MMYGRNDSFLLENCGGADHRPGILTEIVDDLFIYRSQQKLY